MNLKKLTGLSVLALLAALAGPAPSPAYRMNQSSPGWQTRGPQNVCGHFNGFDHWNVGTITWYLNTSGMTSQQVTDRSNAIQDALDTWNGAGLDRQLVWGGTYSGLFKHYDGKNVMRWSTDDECDEKSCHAITAVYMQGPPVAPTNGNVIIESDILFNAGAALNFDWRTDGNFSPECWETVGSSGLMIDTQGVATHELGHSLGIGHTEKPSPPDVLLSSTVPTMGGIGCTEEARDLATDDLNALNCSMTRYPYNPDYAGELEVVNCREISGWALNESETWQKSYVELLFPNTSTVKAVLNANFYTGGPHGVHYFRYTPNNTFFTGVWYLVGARYSGNGAALTGSPKPIICYARIFKTQSPAESASTGGVYTVGTRFSSNQAGYITELGFHRADGETGSNTLRLWTDGGEELANKMATCTEAGWCWVNIPDVPITANTYYRVTVNTNTKQSKTGCGLGSGITNDPLTAHHGYWIAGNAFPKEQSCTNFFVDVRFDM